MSVLKKIFGTSLNEFIIGLGNNRVRLINNSGAFEIKDKDGNVVYKKSVRVPHTWAISGEIKVPSGDTDFIMPMFVDLPTGQSAKLVMARYIINSGTSATVKLQKNGSDITGFTSISVTTTVGVTDPDDITLADNDKLALVVTAVSGTPKNMSFTIFIDYTV